MTPNGEENGGLSARRRANLVTGLRRFLPETPPEAAPPAPAAAADEQCELCTLTLAANHRHLLHLDERRILCVCETCWAVRSGEAEFRPVGNRTVWLDDFALTDEQWASFQIPIGLAFFMVSTVSGGVIALYPSPAGATECELDLESWQRLVTENPALADLEADAEALIVNRMAEEPKHVIAPIDVAYQLVGRRQDELGGHLGRQRDRGGRRALLRGAARAGGGPMSVPDPVFEVVGVEPVAHAASPTLRFTLRVTEAAERSLHAIALSAQINIDPARRTYDAETRDRLVELFGPPERWASTTRSFLWTQVGALVPEFTGSADFTLTVPCTYDLEISAAKYFYSLPDGEIPLTFHFSGTILYSEERAGADRDGAVELLGEVQARGRGLEGDDGALLPGRRLGAARDRDARPPAGAQGRVGPAVLRRLRRRAAGGLMLEQLVDTLLYEGYALYPYTPGATKNATPTPFGIVYPPVYAAGSGATFDHLQIECVAEIEDPDTTFAGEIRFLQASGERHQAEERRLELPRDALRRVAHRALPLRGAARARDHHRDPAAGSAGSA